MNKLTLAFIAFSAVGILVACEKPQPPSALPAPSKAAEPDQAVPSPSSPQNMVMVREFDAPVERVWRAWSDGAQVMRWWGPTGFTSPSCNMDFRVGGTALVCMRAPKEFGGQDMYNTWTYTDIVPLQKIDFVLRFCDKDGKAIDPATIGLPAELNREVRHLITFVSKPGNKTEMTITEFGYTSQQMIDLSRQGLAQCLDKMAATFAGE